MISENSPNEELQADSKPAENAEANADVEAGNPFYTDFYEMMLDESGSDDNDEEESDDDSDDSD